MWQGTGFGFGRPGFEFCLPHLPVVWIWIYFLISLGYILQLWLDMVISLPIAQGYCENETKCVMWLCALSRTLWICGVTILSCVHSCKMVYHIDCDVHSRTFLHLSVDDFASCFSLRIASVSNVGVSLVFLCNNSHSSLLQRKVRHLVQSLTWAHNTSRSLLHQSTPVSLAYSSTPRLSVR